MTGAFAWPTTHRHNPAEPHDVVVVEAGSGVPPWVVAWSRATGRGVRPRALRDGDTASPFAGPDRGNELTALAHATTSAHQALLVILSPSDPRPDGAPQVVAAVRRLPDDGSALDAAAECADSLDGELVLAHCVPHSFGGRSVGLADALVDGERVLDEAARNVTRTHPRLTVGKRLFRMRPHELFDEIVDADLLVVGSAHPDPPARLGLVALSAAQHASCPVLLVPRLR